MQFPLSNSDLQNYRTNLLKEEIKNRQAFIITEICSGVKNTLLSSTNTFYIYGAEKHLVFDSLRLSIPAFPQERVINNVLTDLSQKFPNSKIILDPLKKTISIDWSDLNAKNIVKSG